MKENMTTEQKKAVIQAYIQSDAYTKRNAQLNPISGEELIEKGIDIDDEEVKILWQNAVLLQDLFFQ
jgi:hypothetical protein